MKDRHWNSVTAALRHGQCILMLGPEIPIESAHGQGTAPVGEAFSFAEALRQTLARELEDDNRPVAGNTLAAIAQQYEDTDGFGPGALRATAERFFKSSAFAPSVVHQKLASLPFSTIVTTCQDALLVRALQGAGKRPITQRYCMRGDKRENPEFAVPGNPGTPLVFHLFGDAKEPSSLVLSENDILDFLIAVVSDRPPLPSSFLRALKRVGQNFLFVRFGIRHWELRLVLKLLIRALELNRSGSAIAARAVTWTSAGRS